MGTSGRLTQKSLYLPQMAKEMEWENRAKSRGVKTVETQGLLRRTEGWGEAFLMYSHHFYPGSPSMNLRAIIK